MYGGIDNYYNNNMNINDNMMMQAKIDTSMVVENKVDNIGKSNLRRELTEREKVELELKKWQKFQKKVFF